MKQKLLILTFALCALCFNAYSQAVPVIDINDGSIADWDNLPAAYVQQAVCPDDAAYTGLKSVKAYANLDYLYLLVEPDMNDITDLEWVPFHIFFDTDNSSATGGYGVMFTDASSDIMMEGALFSGGTAYTYEPMVFKWWGGSDDSDWSNWINQSVEHDNSDCWGAIVCEGALQGTSSQYVNGKFEIMIDRNYIPANWNNTQFGLGIEIEQDWATVGILPQLNYTSAHYLGNTSMMKINVHQVSGADNPETPNPGTPDTIATHVVIYNYSTSNTFNVYGASGTFINDIEWPIELTTSCSFDLLTTREGQYTYLEIENNDALYSIRFILRDTTYRMVVTDEDVHFWTSEDVSFDYGVLRYRPISMDDHTVYVYGTTTKDMTAIVVPDSVPYDGEMYAVTKISDYAFSNCIHLSHIELGENITSFGRDILTGCDSIKSVQWNVRELEGQYPTVPRFGSNVESLRFGNHVEVLPNSFCADMYKLTELEIPASVRRIGSFALYCGYEEATYVTRLRKVVIHSTHLENQVFYEKDDDGTGIMLNRNLDTIIAPASVFGDFYFYTYGDYFLTARNIKYLKITGDELTEELSALKYIHLSERTLKTFDAYDATNTTLPDEAFSGFYNMTSLRLPANLETISYRAVADCKSLTSIDIPASVQTIEPSAFEDCRSLVTVNFGAGSQLQTIGNWAFYNCHALTNITIPAGVEEIGDGAFYDCTYLEDVSMPASVQRVGDNAFALCQRMNKMTVEAIVPPVANARTFFGVNRNIPVYVPDASLNDYRNAQYWQEFFLLPISQTPQGLENNSKTVHPVKTIQNGQILILRGDKTYTITGQEVK